MKNDVLLSAIIPAVFFCLIINFFGCKSSGVTTASVPDETDSVWTNRVVRINKYKDFVDSLNNEMQWKKTSFGLWRSKYGDLGLKTVEGTEQAIFIEKYITTICCDYEENAESENDSNNDNQEIAFKSLKETIDTLTFKYIGSSFYKDKNHIYTHYMMSDGGNFWIVPDADPKTFMIMEGECYAKDKNHIFGEREMKMDSVDYKTFRTDKNCGCYAKDKNGFYYWAQKINMENLNEVDLKMIKKLKRLK